jgi:hypothetical protein
VVAWLAVAGYSLAAGCLPAWSAASALFSFLHPLRTCFYYILVSPDNQPLLRPYTLLWHSETRIRALPRVLA